MTPIAPLLVVMGTRPEAVKLLPVVEACRARALNVLVAVTGQHREMLDQMLGAWSVTPDIDLDLMQTSQALGDLTGRVLSAMAPILGRLRPGLTVYQGDTTTAFAGALASYYAKVPVAHVEAGLRTWNRYHPFPEELNRRLIGSLADLHFAPTELARRNLLREGVPGETIKVTGNTVVDALRTIQTRIEGDPALRRSIESRFQYLDATRRLILVTAHRRESLGEGLEEICGAIKELVDTVHDVEVVYPVHRNPLVRSTVESLLGRSASPARIHLVDPLPYESFVYLLGRCHLVLTDSGGIQEEAPTFGKPVLVMREVTERPEAVEAGVARVVGVRRAGIVRAGLELLTDRTAYAAMSRPTSPFGDGHAGERIANHLLEFLSK